ncbi:MAG TPA: hypothetical protein VHN99_07590 [Deinococcales bacterium]|nr:hypothetical protein [Deinococcales bacterium]
MTRFLAVLLVLAFAGSADAHRFRVDLAVTPAGNAATVTATTPGNGQAVPVTGMKLAFVLYDAANRFAAPMPETGTPGVYRLAFPAARGEMTLLVRDTTFRSEEAEVSRTLNWPPRAPFALILPPAAAGVNLMNLLYVLAAPVVAALGVLAWALLRPKGRTGGAAAQ